MRRAGLAALVVMALGCSAPEPEPEPEASKAAAEQGAQAWSPEMIEKMKTAHERARSGADESGQKPAQK